MVLKSRGLAGPGGAVGLPALRSFSHGKRAAGVTGSGSLYICNSYNKAHHLSEQHQMTEFHQCCQATIIPTQQNLRKGMCRIVCREPPLLCCDIDS